MTRSHKGPSRQERFTASVRAKAARDGVHFGAVLPEAKARTVANKDKNTFDHPGASVNRRSHSRNGAKWKGGQFICGSQVDDGNDSTAQKLKAEIDDDTLKHQQEDQDAPHCQSEMTVTIQEIARPARIKALRKQYEFIFVSRVADVRSAEDEYDIVSSLSTSLTVGEEEWEDVCDESDRGTANGIT